MGRRGSLCVVGLIELSKSHPQGVWFTNCLSHVHCLDCFRVSVDDLGRKGREGEGRRRGEEREVRSGDGRRGEREGRRGREIISGDVSGAS